MRLLFDAIGQCINWSCHGLAIAPLRRTGGLFGGLLPIIVERFGRGNRFHRKLNVPTCSEELLEATMLSTVAEIIRDLLIFVGVIAALLIALI